MSNEVKIRIKYEKTAEMSADAPQPTTWWRAWVQLYNGYGSIRLLEDAPDNTITGVTTDPMDDNAARDGYTMWRDSVDKVKEDVSKIVRAVQSVLREMESVPADEMITITAETVRTEPFEG